MGMTFKHFHIYRPTQPKTFDDPCYDILENIYFNSVTIAASNISVVTIK